MPHSRSKPAPHAAWLCALWLFTLPALAAPFTVTAGRAAAPPPGAGVMAGYFTAVNDSTQPVRITGAHAPGFDRIELHRTQHDEGTTSMMRVEQLELAPGERVRLAPGGLHLMMFDPESRPRRGDSIELELTTSAGPVPVTLSVVEPAALLHSGGHE